MKAEGVSRRWSGCCAGEGGEPSFWAPAGISSSLETLDSIANTLSCSSPPSCPSCPSCPKTRHSVAAESISGKQGCVSEQLRGKTCVRRRGTPPSAPALPNADNSALPSLSPCNAEETLLPLSPFLPLLSFLLPTACQILGFPFPLQGWDRSCAIRWLQTDDTWQCEFL